ncbi:MAG: flagellar export protein FliJ [Endozoicomonas sp.]
MKKKKQLDRLIQIREVVCEKVKEGLFRAQTKLTQEEMTLEQLLAYQQSYAWQKDRKASGLALSSAQMMAVNVGKAVQHQRQQVAVQTANCRSAQENYVVEKRQLRTAEVLLEKHQSVLDRKAEKAEQNLQDEFSARIFYSA